MKTACEQPDVSTMSENHHLVGLSCYMGLHSCRPVCVRMQMLTMASLAFLLDVTFVTPYGSCCLGPGCRWVLKCWMPHAPSCLLPLRRQLLRLADVLRARFIQARPLLSSSGFRNAVFRGTFCCSSHQQSCLHGMIGWGWQQQSGHAMMASTRAALLSRTVREQCSCQVRAQTLQTQLS